MSNYLNLFKYYFFNILIVQILLMKENDDYSFNEEYSIKNKEITNDSLDQFRYVLENKKYLYICLDENNHIYITINNHSFLKINQMIESCPEENVVFIFDKNAISSSHNSPKLSRISLKSNKRKEEIINTEIVNPNIDNQINNNYSQNIYINTSSNDNQDEFIFTNDVQDIQYLRNNSKGIMQNSTNTIYNTKKCLIFKWIFHFYLIVGFIIFIHFLSFIFWSYNESFYKWVCILLVISLLYVGLCGIKNKNSNERNFIFDGNNLFWINLFIFILAIICLVGVISIEGHFKYIIMILYLTIILIEAIFILYNDVIIKVISLDRINNDKNIDEFNKNSLKIQLVDFN